ncbi:hypothetical protein TNCV_4091991, partial [Trichonephila clavipes]
GHANPDDLRTTVDVGLTQRSPQAILNGLIDRNASCRIEACVADLKRVH